MTSIQDEQVEALVRRYAEAAGQHGRATEAGDHKKANQAHEAIASVYRELRSRGLEAQRALLVLLDDSEPGVRLWAASHALEFSPADGERVLSSMANVPKSFLSFSADMTLRQWREGTLRFP
jgi:hypothetical protein